MLIQRPHVGGPHLLPSHRGGCATSRLHEMWVRRMLRPLCCDPLKLLTPPVLQKVWQVQPIIELRPPHAHPLRPNHDVHSLFQGGIPEFSEHLPRNQHSLAVTKPQHQKIQPRLRSVGGLHYCRKALECLRLLECGIDFCVRSSILRMSSHASSLQAPSTHRIAGSPFMRNASSRMGEKSWRLTNLSSPETCNSNISSDL